MSFLSTFYLWLLPLSTLPLLIHLFFNRKYKVIEFSSIKFLKILKIDSIRKVKIIEILLLFIRTLILIFIILMLSKPVIKTNSFSSFTSDDPIFCIIALDDSFSVTRSLEDISMDSYYSADIKKLIKTLPNNSELEAWYNLGFIPTSLIASNKRSVPKPFTSLVYSGISNET